MLREWKNHTMFLIRVSRLIPVVLLAGVVLVLVLGRGAPADTRALSWRCMESLVGGETGCNCDNCHTISDELLQCYHMNNPGAPAVPTTCYTTGCVNDVLLTKGCSPNNGPGADGCDTDDDPSTCLFRQYIYRPSWHSGDPDPKQDETCVMKTGAGPNWFLWRKVWHGCDTSSNHSCSTQEIWCACEATSCTKTDLDADVPRGTGYKCGC